MTNSERQSLINTLLDAAAGIIFEEGIGALTLDKAAARAVASKGGLLHHFPSKDALVDALVQRAAKEWRTDLEQAIAAFPAGPTRVPRAMISCCVTDPNAWDDHLRTTSIALMAALASDRRHAVPIREVFNHLLCRMEEDGMPKPEAEMFLAVMDGLWIAWAFDLRDQMPERRRRVHEALDSVLKRIEASVPPVNDDPTSPNRLNESAKP